MKRRNSLSITSGSMRTNSVSQTVTTSTYLSTTTSRIVKCIKPQSVLARPFINLFSRAVGDDVSVRSFQDDLTDSEILKEDFKYGLNTLKRIYRARVDKATSTTSVSTKSSVTSETQTEVSSPRDTESTRSNKRIMYLLGHKNMVGEEEGEESDFDMQQPQPEGEEEETGTTEAMKQAQKYLRVHQIFPFFQFIIAHLLSATPNNPIQFIIDILDKCLVYRAGFSAPPLLYTQSHLECLFYLMDRMRTEYIELEQYNTGMRTLGIADYNKHPNLTTNLLVKKEDFIEEAYNCLTNQLNDLIRRRWLKGLPPAVPPPPPTPETLMMASDQNIITGSDMDFTIKIDTRLHSSRTALFLQRNL